MKLTSLLAALLLAPALATAQPRLNAASAIVLDVNGDVQLEKRADEVRPIASISKLLVGSVMIAKLPTIPNAELDLGALDVVTITGAERDLMFGLRPRHDRKVTRGSSYTPEQLLNISLISSNNVATAALALRLGLGDVISETNERLQAAGLHSISISEPTGLSRANVASARDLASFALSVTYTDLARISVTPQYTIGKVTYNSTNVFTRLDGWQPLVQKTGYTKPAGRCMVLVLEVRHRLYAIVLLGAKSQPEIWQDVVSIRKFLGDEGFVEPKIARAVNSRRGGRP